MKKFFNLILVFFITLNFSFSQEFKKEAYILSIEGNDIYLDLKKGEINVGDMFKVEKERDFMIHPVSKDTIWKKASIISNLTIEQIEDDYSIAKVYPLNSIDLLSAGMKVYKMTNDERINKSFKRRVMVQSISIAGSIHGEHLGLYLGDLLTEQLFSSGEFKMVDRSTLDLQLGELNLSESGVLNEVDRKKIGSTKGIDYIIVGTAYPPDVVVKSTGIPLKSILTVAEIASGENLGAKYASNLKTEKLEAIVKISLRVVNVKTGEIEFICTEMRKAEGKSDLRLEGGALHGLELNGGITDFLNTISGQASQVALKYLTTYLVDYFQGKITVNNFQGNMIEAGKVKVSKIPLNMNLNIGDEVIYYLRTEGKPNIHDGTISSLHYEKPYVQLNEEGESSFHYRNILKKESEFNYSKISEGSVVPLGTQVVFFEGNNKHKRDQLFFKGEIVHVENLSKGIAYTIKDEYIENGLKKFEFHKRIPPRHIRLITNK